MRYLPLCLLPILLLACGPEKDVPPPIPFGAVPTQAQLDWHAMEMNAFLHFTTNTFTDKEWGYGDESPEIFNPTALDVDQWMTTLSEAGFQGVILTCKHHDGFTLWPSAYTDHSVAASPWQNGEGDLVRLVEESARRHGLKFGVYLSPWDRNRADYGDSTYVDYYRNQLTELFTEYGPIFEMWFDGANGGDGYYGGADERRSINGRYYYDWPTTIDMVRELQPDPHVIVFSDAGPDIRWVGNEKGVAGESNWNTLDTDTLYAGQPGITDLLNSGTAGASTWIPAEVDVSIRPGWFYHESQDSLVKTPEQLFNIYLTSVGRGSNLLLNVPPDRRGLIHENDVASLQAWRQLLDERLSTNLAADATATSSHHRGNSKDFAPENVLDDDLATYWATDDEFRKGELYIEFPEPREINYVQLEEPIALGQRIASFSLAARLDGEWREIGGGTTVGYKRIIPVGALTTDAVAIQIDTALACPLLSSVKIY